MAESDPLTVQGQDLSVSPARAHWLTLAIGAPLVGLMLVVYGVPALQPPPASVVIFLLITLAGILVHEAIHGLAWACFARLPLRRIRFGFRASTLTPYAQALDPMPARAYRLGAVMPALLLGGLPFVLGALLESQALALFGMVFTFAAGGALLILWLIRGVSARARVLDHPSRVGCIVLPPAA